MDIPEYTHGKNGFAERSKILDTDQKSSFVELSK